MGTDAGFGKNPEGLEVGTVEYSRASGQSECPSDLLSRARINAP